MKSRVLPLVLLAVVFMFVSGCNGGQSVIADSTSEVPESTSYYFSETTDITESTEIIEQDSDVYEQTDTLTAIESTSYVPAKSDETQPASPTVPVSSSAAKTTASASGTKVLITSTSRMITTTKAATTTKPVTTAKAVTTTDSVTTTKETTATTTSPSGGSVIITPDVTTTTSAGGSVKLYISCRKAVDYGIREHPGYDVIIPENGVLLNTTATIESGDTVMSLLVRELKKHGISLNRNGDYIRGIGGLNEKDCGATSGWLYSVNDVFPSNSTASYKLSAGDSVKILYSIVNGDVTLTDS